MKRLISILEKKAPGIFGVKLSLFFLLFLFSCSTSDDYSKVLEITNYPDRKQDFSLWQLEPFFFEVQMSYILRTDDGKITVVDGGGKVSAGLLEGYLAQLGGEVHTWVITHPHTDHMDALLEIIGSGKIRIKRILHSAQNPEWVKLYEPGSLEDVLRYYTVLEQSGIPIVDIGEMTDFTLGDGVQLKVLGVRNEEIQVNAVNNSSLVFRVSSHSKSVLFLGDLGVEGGNKILQGNNIGELRSDYVQMAHHGQEGVDRSFYEVVRADYALWPTPKWLWENRAEGKEVNTGNYKIMQVQQWMRELGIERNYVSGLDGTIQID